MRPLDGFDQFWSVYPRKVAKADARKAWEKTAAVRPPIERIVKAVICARATEDWRKDDGRYVPYPATWINGERWDDVHEVEVDRVKDGKAWHESVSGIERRAKELNMEWNAREESWQQFAQKVIRASDAGDVVAIRRA